MLDQGVPITFVKWLRAFLTDRRARVRLNNTTSSSQRMKQGLPQGSVLAPLLFLFYINNLANILSEENVKAMFADDVTILATHREKAVAEAAAQRAVDIVTAWSKAWKLTLNAGKSEAAFFSTWSNESRLQPNIQVDGQLVPTNNSPRLLGVLLDRSLTFNAHIAKISETTTRRIRCLRAVAHSDWGWDKQSLRTIFFALIRSSTDYAAPAWQPWLSGTNIDRLDRIQNKGLRAITGQYGSAPLEALRIEADIPSYATTSKRVVLKSFEKAMRSAPDHPKKIAFQSATEPRTTRTSWYSKTRELALLLPAECNQRLPIQLFTVAPWLEQNIECIKSTVPGMSGRNDEAATKLAACLATIREANPDITIYTDGSATAGLTNGGAAAVITRGDPATPHVIHTIEKRGRALTSSYEEEAHAMKVALEWIRRHVTDPATSVLICTDSQSLCTALESNNPTPSIGDIRLLLTTIKARLAIQWVPGHCDLPGNELADAAAKEAAASTDDTEPISFESACTTIKTTITDGEPTHQRTREIYSKLNKREEDKITSRADQVLLAQLRSGHHNALRAYKKRVYGAETDASCPSCGEAEQDLEHWLVNCPAGSNWRMERFGTHLGSLEWLTSHPEEVVAYARKSLLDLDAGP